MKKMKGYEAQHIAAEDVEAGMVTADGVVVRVAQVGTIVAVEHRSTTYTLPVGEKVMVIGYVDQVILDTVLMDLGRK